MKTARRLNVMRRVTYEARMYTDLCRWRDDDPGMGRHVVEIIELAISSPKAGPGRPKRLAGLPGVWSRRITQHHRLFYLVTDEALHFLTCHGHDLPEHMRKTIREGRW